MCLLCSLNKNIKMQLVLKRKAAGNGGEGGTNVYKHLVLEGRCFTVPARDDGGSDVTSGLPCIGTADSWGQLILCCGGYPVLYRTLSTIPGLRHKMPHCQTSLRGPSVPRPSLAENHWAGVRDRWTEAQCIPEAEVVGSAAALTVESERQRLMATMAS